MHNYAEISNRAIQYHQDITKSKKQIEALTVALIGAAALGNDVRSLKFDKDELLKLDLTDHINIFKESDKSVDELETYLLEKYENVEKLAIYFRSENSQIKQHFKMCPKNFFHNYISIEIEQMNELQKKDGLEKFTLYAKDKNIKYILIFNENENNFSLFFKDEEDLYKIKQYFHNENDKIDYTVKEYELNPDNEDYLSYLILR